jgi:hypothetical protein
VSKKTPILGNLKEMFNKLKNDFPDVKTGFSKFCQFRPSYVILAVAAGAHSVCVCVQYRNVKLLADAIKLNGLTTEMNVLQEDLQDILERNMIDAITYDQ